MTCVSKPTIFQAAIGLLPHVADRPLGKLSVEERDRAVEAAVSMARRVANLCADGAWGPTIEPVPSRVEELAGPRSGKPEWIRMPTRGKCPHTGLSRSGLYQLVSPCAANGYTPPVRSVVLRRRGMVRGTRLISYDSLMAYLGGLPSDSKGERAARRGGAGAGSGGIPSGKLASFAL